MLSSLWRWLRPAPTEVHVVLYTRAGCHLCDDAEQTLQDARRRHRFTFESIDVDTSRELVEQFGLCVPVVTVNGKVRFRGRVNPILLKRLLEHRAGEPGA